tara:strand:+ start:319 stop:441 length:123 start_codon:yes stop_codon:yes gene_type:complete
MGFMRYKVKEVNVKRLKSYIQLKEKEEKTDIKYKDGKRNI